MAYADQTRVPASKTRTEIEELLKKKGATQFMSYSDADSFTICFAMGLLYRFTMQLPEKVSQHEINRLWRCLGLSIKSKFVAIENGISTVEHEFLANAVTDDQRTVGERMIPEMKQAALEGRVPKALALPGRASA